MASRERSLQEGLLGGSKERVMSSMMMAEDDECADYAEQHRVPDTDLWGSLLGEGLAFQLVSASPLP